MFLVGVLLVTFDLLTCVHSQGMLHVYSIDGLQLSVLLPEGKCVIKRQLYSELSLCEKQLHLSFSTNGKDPT